MNRNIQKVIKKSLEFIVELEELNKPTELKNRAESDSSAGSKNSTQKGSMSSAHYAEESSGKNISQSENIGNNETLKSTKFSFAGKKALTANQQALSKARRMDESGWFKVKDNKWSFEIYDNPALFDAYPKL